MTARRQTARTTHQPQKEKDMSTHDKPLSVHGSPEEGGGAGKRRIPTVLAATALAVAVIGSTPVGHAVAHPTEGSGALASGNRSNYASPELLQLGFGPAGPPAASGSPVRETASAGAGRDYGSAEIIQLGHGPGGPPASGPS
jgi:hypothetical protein